MWADVPYSREWQHDSICFNATERKVTIDHRKQWFIFSSKAQSLISSVRFVYLESSAISSFIERSMCHATAIFVRVQRSRNMNCGNLVFLHIIRFTSNKVGLRRGALVGRSFVWLNNEDYGDCQNCEGVQRQRQQQQHVGIRIMFMGYTGFVEPQGTDALRQHRSSTTRRIVYVFGRALKHAMPLVLSLCVSVFFFRRCLGKHAWRKRTQKEMNNRNHGFEWSRQCAYFYFYLHVYIMM